METREGNCYSSSEALWFILGGKDSDWQVMRLRPEKEEKVSHWFLQHKETDIILDPSVQQFGNHPPDYSRAIRAAFYPNMSQRAKKLIEVLTWQ